MLPRVCYSRGFNLLSLPIISCVHSTLPRTTWPLNISTLLSNLIHANMPRDILADLIYAEMALLQPLGASACNPRRKPGFASGAHGFGNDLFNLTGDDEEETFTEESACVSSTKPSTATDTPGEDTCGYHTFETPPSEKVTEIPVSATFPKNARTRRSLPLRLKDYQRCKLATESARPMASPAASQAVMQARDSDLLSYAEPAQRQTQPDATSSSAVFDTGGFPFAHMSALLEHAF